MQNRMVHLLIQSYFKMVYLSYKNSLFYFNHRMSVFAEAQVSRAHVTKLYSRLRMIHGILKSTKSFRVKNKWYCNCNFDGFTPSLWLHLVLALFGFPVVSTGFPCWQPQVSTRFHFVSSCKPEETLGIQWFPRGFLSATWVVSAFQEVETTGKLGVASMETRGLPRINPEFPAGFLGKKTWFFVQSQSPHFNFTIFGSS